MADSGGLSLILRLHCMMAVWAGIPSMRLRVQHELEAIRCRRELDSTIAWEAQVFKPLCIAKVLKIRDSARTCARLCRGEMVR